MTTLLVPVTINLSATSLTNIDVIDFTNAAATTTTVTFASTQFNNVSIMDFVLMDGSAGINAIVVNGGSVNASQWAFANWTAGADTIRLNGSGGADSITGSSQNDFIDGGQGADFLAGAGGDDIFDYSALELAAGESIQGGGGTGDILRLNQAASTYLFSTQATLIEVERLEFNSTNSITAEFTGSQMADFTSITGGTGLDTLRIIGAMDLSPMSFTNWSANDVIRFIGTAVAETVTGTAFNDIFEGSAGVDDLFGGLGDDTFVYTQGSQVVDDEDINGGGGTGDRLQLFNTGAINFFQANLLDVEILDFVSGTSAVTLGTTDIGPFAGRLTTIDGSSSADTLIVKTDTGANLSTTIFTNWTDVTDSITIISTSVQGGSLLGTAFRDTIQGGTGQNIITGGLGADVMIGGSASDDFVYVSPSDVAAGETMDGGGNNFDTIRIDEAISLNLDVVAISNVELLEFRHTVGTAFAGLLSTQIGGSGIVGITGGTSTDALRVTGTLINLASIIFNSWTNGTDSITLIGTDGDDTITGSSQNDAITGGDGADTISAGAGDDRIVLNSAFDFDNGTMDGGTGLADILVQNTGNSGTFYTTTNLTNIERLEFGGSGGTATFQAANFGTSAGRINSVTGSALADRIDIAGAGIDLSTIAFASWTNGVDRIFLNGTSGADTIIGSVQDDSISGGNGIDTMTGGTGSDTYQVDDTLDAIIETAGDAADRVSASVSYTLGAGDSIEFMEVADIASPVAINLTGNEFAQTITGSVAANVLNGGIDNLADTLIGRQGNDTYIINSASDNITELAGGGAADRAKASVTFALGAGDDIEFLETVNAAGVSAISLTGNELAQTLTGNAGQNVLIGGAGADILAGLGGNDSYGVDDVLDSVLESAGGGTDRIFASVSFTLAVGQEIETLSTNANSGAAAINLTGNEFGNALIGNLGANVLNGAGGVDTMTGLAGNDSYAVDNALDAVVEAAGGGADRVFASVNYTLAAGQEIETLSTNANAGVAAINLTGNELGNALIGNAAANVLNGGAGVDTLTGLNGNDSYAVDSASDSVIEAVGGGTDRIFASVNYTLAAGQEIETLSTANNAGAAAINLTGNAFGNTLIGNAGANLLLGGLGNDTLTGLNGADTFVFNTTLNAATNHDTITDFNVAADTIQLENAIFTLLTATGTLTAGLFKDLSLAAQDANDIIVYNRATGDLFYDTNGLTAGGQTLFADVTNGTALTFADFVVT